MKTNSSEFLKNLAGTYYKTNQEINKIKESQPHGFESGKMSTNPKVPTHLTRLLYISAIGIFAFVGAEPVKVIYRKNFGPGGINQLCLIVSCAFFAIIGLILSGMGIAAATGMLDNRSELDFIKSEGILGFIVSGVLYVYLAQYAFTKGMKDIKIANQGNKPAGYLGDSELLAGLKKEKWTEQKIQWVAEPCLTILLGLIITLWFNVVAGIPIIICGFSLWVYNFIDYFFLKDDLSDTIDRMNANNAKDEEYHNVESD